ncbi:MAG: DEAD/DEAH box helicase [Candidatus Omnitrophica bacterium]|nr:DEAD/DEAH box helicase [Candidatus Omnitrophota bacterium]
MLDKFKSLGLSENVLATLKRKGYEEPTKIQEQVIPLLLQADMHIVGQAQTGTGKTAAFGLPIIEKIKAGTGKVQALILTPTRELALQVAEEINSLKGSKSLEVIPIYGGQSMEQQLYRLRRGVDIVVGTPGRVKDHLQRGTLIIKEVSYVVLDEADEMLNMGFIDDVEDILSYTNTKKSMLLFSATIPPRILGLAKKYMSSYKLVKIPEKSLTVNLTDQIYFEVLHSDKLEALCRIIDCEPYFYGLVFCRTKIDVDKVSKKLSDRGYNAEGLNGDISQNQRERILTKFKDKRVNILVATDVAARGIDIENVSHVINYSLPQNPEGYVHRIGRTGRAGKEGTAITFVTPQEYRKLAIIKRIARTEIRKGKLPQIDMVIKTKKELVKSSIRKIMQSSENVKHLDLAQDILAESDPKVVVSALIEYAFGSELDADKYNKISDVSIDNKGTTRLFIARGKNDKMDRNKLVELIRRNVNINVDKIYDICIFDNFSFITVPFQEAELILKVFKKGKSGGKALVELAKSKQPAKKHFYHRKSNY